MACHRSTAVPALVRTSLPSALQGMLPPPFFLLPEVVAIPPPWVMAGTVFTGVRPPLLGVYPSRTGNALPPLRVGSGKASVSAEPSPC